MLTELLLLLIAATGTAETRDPLILIHEDYSRDDLLLVAESGSSDESPVNRTWKVSEETLELQRMYTWESLLSQVPAGQMAPEAIRFIDSTGPDTGTYIGNLRFSSCEYATVNDARFGSDDGVPRNDWVLIFNFTTGDGTSGDAPERVFMLPDGSIIISSEDTAGIS